MACMFMSTPSTRTHWTSKLFWWICSIHHGEPEKPRNVGGNVFPGTFWRFAKCRGPCGTRLRNLGKREGLRAAGSFCSSNPKYYAVVDEWNSNSRDCPKRIILPAQPESIWRHERFFSVSFGMAGGVWPCLNEADGVTDSLELDGFAESDSSCSAHFAVTQQRIEIEGRILGAPSRSDRKTRVSSNAGVKR